MRWWFLASSVLYPLPALRILLCALSALLIVMVISGGIHFLFDMNYHLFPGFLVLLLGNDFSCCAVVSFAVDEFTSRLICSTVPNNLFSVFSFSAFVFRVGDTYAVWLIFYACSVLGLLIHQHNILYHWTYVLAAGFPLINIQTSIASKWDKSCFPMQIFYFVVLGY